MGITQGLLKGERRRVLIVDDHPVLRRGILELLADEPDVVVCGQAATVCEALELIETLAPHLVLVDLSLHDDRGGIVLIEQLRKRGGIKTLVLSMHDESLFAERSLRAGASGYVNKQSPPETLLQAIREVLADRIYLSPNLASRLPHLLGWGVEPDPIENLSERELQIFKLIGQGRSARDIATALGLSCKTIESHREKIKLKLGLANSMELTRRSVQWMLERQ